MESIITILLTIIAVFGSAGAWRFYEKRAIFKEKNENFIKDDYKERILKLEILLERSSKEKESMRKEILDLTALVAELNVKVEFLEKENRELHKNLQRKCMVQ